MFLQSPLDIFRSLHLNEGLASWKTAVVETEIDPCIPLVEVMLHKFMLTIRSTIDFAVLEEPAQVNGAGVVGQTPHLDDGGVVFH